MSLASPSQLLYELTGLLAKWIWCYCRSIVWSVADKCCAACMDVSVQYIHESAAGIIKIWKWMKKKKLSKHDQFKCLVSLWTQLLLCFFFIVEENMPGLKNKLIQPSPENMFWKKSLSVLWPFFINGIDFLIIFHHINKTKEFRDPHEFISHLLLRSLLAALSSFLHKMRLLSSGHAEKFCPQKYS